MARVLIADDSPKDVLTLVRRLAELGHEVIYSGYSLEAQTIMHYDKINCAIFDGCLPKDSDGLNPSGEWGGAFLAREAKRVLPDLKCVVYTTGLDEKYLAQLTDLRVPVFLKRVDSVDSLIEALGL